MKQALSFVLLFLLTHVAVSGITREYLQGEWWIHAMRVVFDGETVAVHYLNPEDDPPELLTTFDLRDGEDGNVLLSLAPAADHPAYTFILTRVSADEMQVTLPYQEPRVTTSDGPVYPLNYIAEDVIWIRTPPYLPEEHFLGFWRDTSKGYSLHLLSDGLAYGGGVGGAGPSRWEKTGSNRVTVSVWWPDEEEGHENHLTLHATPLPDILAGRTRDRTGFWEREEEKDSEITREMVLYHMDQMRQVFAEGPLVRAMVRGAPARITVLIQDEDGAPLENIAVQVSYMSDRSQWIPGHTDGEGRFTSEDLSRGEMLVSIREPGYEKVSPKNPIRFSTELTPDNTRWSPWGMVVTTIVRRVESEHREDSSMSHE